MLNESWPPSNTWPTLSSNIQYFCYRFMNDPYKPTRNFKQNLSYLKSSSVEFVVSVDSEEHLVFVLVGSLTSLKQKQI